MAGQFVSYPKGMIIGELTPPLVYNTMVWVDRSGSLPIEAGKKAGPKIMRTRELSLPLVGCSARELALVVWCWTAEGLTSSATTQVKIPGFDLDHTNIYPIYELLKYV